MAAKVGRRKYVVIASGLGLLAGVGLLGGRMIWQQYGLSQREQIMATAPSMFDQGVHDQDVAPDKDTKDWFAGVYAHHPAYLLGMASKFVIGMDCDAGKMQINVFMATCATPTAQLRALGTYILKFTDHPLPPNHFDNHGIILDPSGHTVRFPSAGTIVDYYGIDYRDSGPSFQHNMEQLLFLVSGVDRTNGNWVPIPQNGEWVKPDTMLYPDVESCYLAARPGDFTAMCFPKD